MPTDIPRFTDDELTALLALHQPKYGHASDPCCNCEEPTPCETVRLATEVRDLRAVEQAGRHLHDYIKERGILHGASMIRMADALTRYEEGGQ